MSEPKKIHFHTFDALRFFAFFKVFIFHVPLILATNPGPVKQWFVDHIRFGGGIGVSFFFVLSGFLITYILSFEKMNADRLDVKRFFIRRAFRIWPLFYLLVIIALVLPYDFAQEIGFHMNWGGYEPDWRYSLTFMENYKTIIMDAPPLTTPLSVFWSLCVEEHFYILWMVVFFFIPRKGIPFYLISTVIIACIFRANHDAIYHTENIRNNDLFTSLDYFAISGLLGYFVAKDYDRVARFVKGIPYAVRYGYIFLVLLFLYFQKDIFDPSTQFAIIFQYTLQALLFTFLLLIFIPKDSKIRISEKNIFTRLGKISYGLYVYHIIWIHVLIMIYRQYGLKLDNWGAYIPFVIITFCGSVGLSILSYRYFEKPILKLRQRWFPS